MLSIERRRGSWAVIARNPSTGEEVGGILESWIPLTHFVWVGPDRSYRLRQNPFNGTRQLSYRGRRLASIRPARSRTTHRRWVAGFGVRPSWEIITHDTTIDSNVSLDLPIILAVEFIKIDSSIVGVGGTSGGG